MATPSWVKTSSYQQNKSKSSSQHFGDTRARIAQAITENED